MPTYCTTCARRGHWLSECRRVDNCPCHTNGHIETHEVGRDRASYNDSGSSCSHNWVRHKDGRYTGDFDYSSCSKCGKLG
jgi:hypothetical protein